MDHSEETRIFDAIVDQQAELELHNIKPACVVLGLYEADVILNEFRHHPGLSCDVGLLTDIKVLGLPIMIDISLPFHTGIKVMPALSLGNIRKVKRAGRCKHE